MVSLYKRATPAQAMMLRIIEGAVKNAADAHPEFVLTDRIARSIAKRATGTLTAHLGQALAAKPPGPLSLKIRGIPEAISGSKGTASTLSGVPKGGVVVGRRSNASQPLKGRTGPGTQVEKFPVHLLIKNISRRIRPLKTVGETEKAELLIEIMRVIDALQR